MTAIKPETETEFDVVVIGTGPGGEGAAMQLAKSGYNVAIVEKHKALGGGCTHWGTIPSKALRHSVSRLIEYNNNPLFSGTMQNRLFVNRRNYAVRFTTVTTLLWCTVQLLF